MNIGALCSVTNWHCKTKVAYTWTHVCVFFSMRLCAWFHSCNAVFLLRYIRLHVRNACTCDVFVKFSCVEKKPNYVKLCSHTVRTWVRVFHDTMLVCSVPLTASERRVTCSAYTPQMVVSLDPAATPSTSLFTLMTSTTTRLCSRTCHTVQASHRARQLEQRFLQLVYIIVIVYFVT